MSLTRPAGRGSVSLADAMGRRYSRIEGVDPVNSVMVRHLLEAMDWDDDRGSSWVPLSTYLTFAMPAYRPPGESLPAAGYPPLPYQDVDLPGDGRMGITVGVTAGSPMSWGDRIRSDWSVTGTRDIETRMGAGQLVDFESHFFNQNDELVAVEATRMLCFRKTDRKSGATAAETAPALADEPTHEFDRGQPAIGQALVPVSLALSPQRLAMITAANRDFSPIHVDHEAAAAIGAPAPVANTMFVVAMVERAVLHNGGPSSRVLSLGPMRLTKSIPAGVRVQVVGTVVDLTHRPGEIEVHVVVRVETSPGGVASHGSAVFAVPHPEAKDLTTETGEQTWISS